jgi:hypothetical protein
MTMVKQLVLSMVAVAVLAACGGGKKASTMPDEDTDDESGPITSGDDASTMVSPEATDEIRRMLDRKQRIISRCLADAVERGDAPANARGKMSLDIVISPAGKAETVRVIKSSFEAQGVQDCVIGHVREIQFPRLPKSYPTSYTYAFEAS